MRVKYEDLLEKFQRILESRGFSGKHAKDAATVFANNSLDGVYSHGVNRFPRVVEYLDKGEIDSAAIATCESSMGAIERWNGHRGFGPSMQSWPWTGLWSWQGSTAWAWWPLEIITTGCGAAATAGRQRTRDASVSAGPTPCPTCLPGAEGTEKSETIHLSCPSPEATENTLSLTAPYPSFLRKDRGGKA